MSFHSPKTLIFLLLFGFVSFWLLTISYVCMSNRKPYIRDSIVHPMYALLPTEKTEESLANGETPVCWGTVGCLFTGHIVFPSMGAARAYMYQHKKAFPPHKTSIYQLSGDYQLDTHPLNESSELRCINKPLTILQPQE